MSFILAVGLPLFGIGIASLSATYMDPDVPWWATLFSLAILCTGSALISVGLS